MFLVHFAFLCALVDVANWGQFAQVVAVVVSELCEPCFLLLDFYHWMRDVLNALQLFFLVVPLIYSVVDDSEQLNHRWHISRGGKSVHKRLHKQGRGGALANGVIELVLENEWKGHLFGVEFDWGEILIDWWAGLFFRSLDKKGFDVVHGWEWMCVWDCFLVYCSLVVDFGCGNSDGEI